MSEFEYTGANARYVNFPLGGIGAGSIGIGADGRFSDWEIYNRPNKGSVNGLSHFAVRVEREGKVLDTRTLHGPYQGDLAGDHLESSFGSYGFGVRRERMAGFPAFEHCTLKGPYPVATLKFDDQRFPGHVQMRALSPFIPMDSESSSLPLAMLEITIDNTTDEALDYTLIGCMGFDFKQRADVEVCEASGRRSLIGRARADKASTDYREIAFTLEGDDISHVHNIYRGSWFDTLEMHWRDISRPGHLKDRLYADGEGSLPGGRYTVAEHGLLASHFSIPAGESRTIRAAIAWYVPNMEKHWKSVLPLLDTPKPVKPVWRNYYATQWQDAAAVSEHAFKQWSYLSGETRRLQQVLADLSMPLVVRDAVSATLSTMKTATVLRLEDGTLYGWEGCDINVGSCEGSCTHVWNYQQAVAFLFPDLERSMHEADYRYNQLPESGGMSFRLSLPLGVGISSFRPCVDGQMGNVLKTYRDWKLSGDTQWLREWWPWVKAALEYAWHPENYDQWDPQRQGVITGRQHHTLDMELFGANAWLTGFYLGALEAAAEMADAVGEPDSAEEYRQLFQNGRRWIDDNLFNGKYYIQDVDLTDRDVLTRYQSDDEAINSNNLGGTVDDVYWDEDFQQLKYQMGEGCSIDQVLGQWHTTLYGLGELFDPDKYRSALLSIYEHNFLRLGDVANPCRVFGVGDERGTLTCAWPESVEYPIFPTPHTHSVMGGYEYAFATHLMMIGELEKGLEVMEAARARYQGHNRNPWNEIECGSNYARSMASYAAVPVLSGFTFEMTKSEIGFAPRIQDEGCFKSIWSAGKAWGEIELSTGCARLVVHGGEIDLLAVTVNGMRFLAADAELVKAEQSANSSVSQLAGNSRGNSAAQSAGLVSLNAGFSLVMKDDRLLLNDKPDISTL